MMKGKSVIYVLGLFACMQSIANEGLFKSLYDSAGRLMAKDTKVAISVMLEAEKIAFDNRDDNQVGKAYWMLGYLHQLQGQYGNSKKYYKSALKRYEKLELVSQQIDLLENLGTIHMGKGLHESAQKYYSHRFKLAKQTNDKIEIAEAHFDLGLVYRKKQDYESSLRELLAGYKIVRLKATTKDYTLLSRLYNEIGLSLRDFAHVSGKLDVLDSAKNNFLQSIEFATSDHLLFRPKNNIGDIYFHQQNYLLAKEWFLQALDHGLKSNSRILITPTLNNLGKVHFKQGDLLKADSLFNLALAYNIENHSVEEVLNDYSLNINFYNLNELMTSMSYLDSINSEFGYTLKSEVIARLNSEDIDRRKFEQQQLAEMASDELKSIDDELARNESESFVVRLVSGTVGIVLLIVVLVLIVLRYRRERMIKESKRTINSKAEKILSRYKRG